MNTSTMFITYDGLLDPLGGSQILPYLYSIASHPRSLHIVSFEKRDRFAAGAVKLRAQLKKRGIDWTPLLFTTGLGKLGKAWDLICMYIICFGLQLRYRFGVIHCRSYQAMQVGCFLSKLTHVRTIFDMRGLWVDERMDGALWLKSRWQDRLAYRIYKRIERRLLTCATHVVALTDRVVPELKKLSPDMTATVTVIPCCADFDHFVQPTSKEREAMRIELGISPSGLMLSYLGSLGTWYVLDEMLRLFAAVSQLREATHILFITRDWGEEQEALVEKMGLGHLRDFIHVLPANRDQVPLLLGASDIMLSFIKPAYSKIASSPTKLAEAFALGIPVISNAGVGDVDKITRELDAGIVIELSESQVFDELVYELDGILAKGGHDLRERTRKFFGLEVAERSYHQVYSALDRAK